MTPEGKVKASVRSILRKHHIHYLHIPGSAFGKNGAPDYVCCVEGRYVEIECKAGKGKQTELQRINQKECVDSKGMYLLVNEENLHSLENFLAPPQTTHWS